MLYNVLQQKKMVLKETGKDKCNHLIIHAKVGGNEKQLLNKDCKLINMFLFLKHSYSVRLASNQKIESAIKTKTLMTMTFFILFSI